MFLIFLRGDWRLGSLARVLSVRSSSGKEIFPCRWTQTVGGRRIESSPARYGDAWSDAQVIEVIGYEGQ